MMLAIATALLAQTASAEELAFEWRFNPDVIGNRDLRATLERYIEVSQSRGTLAGTNTVPDSYFGFEVIEDRQFDGNRIAKLWVKTDEAASLQQLLGVKEAGPLTLPSSAGEVDLCPIDIDDSDGKQPNIPIRPSLP